MVEKHLKTKAKDNYGNEYPVSLCFNKNNKWVLLIHNTGGSWFMSSLMGYQDSVIAFDYGQNWNCVNIKDVLHEAKSLI